MKRTLFFYLSAKGLEQLIGTVQKVRRNINPKLQFDGILLTMVDSRTNNAKEISDLIRNTYGQATPSLSQAQRLKKLSQDGKCTLEAMRAVMSERGGLVAPIHSV